MELKERTPLSLEAASIDALSTDLSTEDTSSERHVNSTKEAGPQTHIVDWDGPDDPENPYNWPKWKRIGHVFLVSILAAFFNLAGTIIAPAMGQISAEFQITDPVLQAFTVTIYLLGFIMGPLFLAPLSELYGRLVIYHACNIVYVAFTIGCAFSSNTTVFLLSRLLTGIGGAGPMSIGGGTVADVTPLESRGKAISLLNFELALAPVIGPIIGGLLTEKLGWRWTFRVTLILTGILALATALIMRETNATVLLRRKTQRLIKETGNDKLTPRGFVHATPCKIICKTLVRPVKMLIFSPIVLLLSLYVGTVFGLVYLLFTTLPLVFEGTYGFTPSAIGLVYIGQGLGFTAGLVTFALYSDKLLGQKQGPEQRLILMKWIAPIIPLGCILYGWTAERHLHWIAPIIGTFIIGLGAMLVMVATQAYVVDAFGSEAAASAFAATLIIRTPFGACLVFAAVPLYTKLGLGWGNTVLGFIVFAFTPVPWLFYRYGEMLRNRFVVDL